MKTDICRSILDQALNVRRLHPVREMRFRKIVGGNQPLFKPHRRPCFPPEAHGLIERIERFRAVLQ